jgi:hypothetical protein
MARLGAHPIKPHLALPRVLLTARPVMAWHAAMTSNRRQPVLERAGLSGTAILWKARVDAAAVSEAILAGEAAGGDEHGKQGAALLIHTTEDYPFLSLRFDDHPDPLVELSRLYQVSLDRFQPFVSCLPSCASPADITDRAVIEDAIARFQAARAVVRQA